MSPSDGDALQNTLKNDTDSRDIVATSFSFASTLPTAEQYKLRVDEEYGSRQAEIRRKSSPMSPRHGRRVVESATEARSRKDRRTRCNETRYRSTNVRCCPASDETTHACGSPTTSGKCMARRRMQGRRRTENTRLPRHIPTLDCPNTIVGVRST